MRFCILNEAKEVVFTNDHRMADRWRELNKPNILKTILEDKEISTVFTGCDHGDGPFETLVRPGFHQRRYHTLVDAIIGHREVVDMEILSIGWTYEEILAREG